MMVTETLRNEHKMILEFLDGLSRILKRMEWQKEAGPEPDTFRNAIEFAREYADRFHHHKEEYLLFGHLAQKHGGELDSQIEKLRQQHEMNRTLLTEAADAIAGYARGEEVSARNLHFNLIKYVANLREHIRHEDDVFFPMADEALTESEDRQLAHEFAKQEEKLGRDFLSKSSAIMSEISRNQ